jgi:predicted HTH transcriptional regulator
MSWNIILEELNSKSTNRARFISRVDTDADVSPTLVALANGKGGRIIIGMDTRNCHLTGTTVNTEWIEQVLQAVCYPRIAVKIEIVYRNDKHIVMIEVSEGDEKPYSYKQAVYIEKDTKILVASNDEVENLQAVSNFKQNKHEIPKHISNSALLYSPNFSLTSEKTPLPVAVVQVDPLTVEEISIQETLDSNAVNELLVRPPARAPKAVAASQASLLQERSPLNARQKKLMNHMRKGNPELNRMRNKKFRKLYEVSHKTAHYELVDLVDRGLLEQEGSGRSTCYKLTQTILTELASAQAS